MRRREPIKSWASGTRDGGFAKTATIRKGSASEVTGQRWETPAQTTRCPMWPYGPRAIHIKCEGVCKMANVEVEREGKWLVGNLKRVVRSILKEASWVEDAFDDEINGLIAEMKEAKDGDYFQADWRQGGDHDFIELYVWLDVVVELGVKKAKGQIYVHWFMRDLVAQ